MKAESSFEAMLPIVMRAVDSVLRRRGKRKDFADDFRGWVVLKMLEREAAVLKQFRGESTLFTYLHVIVARLYCDYLISQNGKWRPSRKARQLGAHAVSLERLVYRDGYTLDEAVAVLRSQEGKSNESELRDEFFEIPRRRPRVSVESEALLEAHPDTRPSVYEVLREKELAQASRALRSALWVSLAELAEDDRLILELRFSRGLRISEISRRLGLNERSAYSHYHRILQVLRAKLEARRVHRGVLTDMSAGSFDLQEFKGVFVAEATRTFSNAATPIPCAQERELCVRLVYCNGRRAGRDRRANMNVIARRSPARFILDPKLIRRILDHSTESSPTNCPPQLPRLQFAIGQWLPESGLELVEGLHEPAFRGEVDPDDPVHPDGRLHFFEQKRQEAPLSFAHVEDFRDERFLFRVPTRKETPRDQGDGEAARPDAALHLLEEALLRTEVTLVDGHTISRRLELLDEMARELRVRSTAIADEGVVVELTRGPGRDGSRRRAQVEAASRDGHGTHEGQAEERDPERAESEEPLPAALNRFARPDQFRLPSGVEEEAIVRPTALRP